VIGLSVGRPWQRGLRPSNPLYLTKILSGCLLSQPDRRGRGRMPETPGTGPPKQEPVIATRSTFDDARAGPGGRARYDLSTVNSRTAGSARARATAALPFRRGAQSALRRPMREASRSRPVDRADHGLGEMIL